MKKILLAALLAHGAAHGAPAMEELRLFVEREAGPAGRVEVQVGSPPARMQLAPCSRMEPFIPGGVRLWGRTTLGVRCVSGATWQVFLPVQVRVFGLAAVAARALAQGEPVTEADVRREEIELSLYPAGSVMEVAQLTGKLLARPLAPGQPLVASWFRARPAVWQGDPVKVLYSGAGFSIATEGKALSHALEGQPVRVLTESGRTLTGIARPGRVVELRF